MSVIGSRVTSKPPAFEFSVPAGCRASEPGPLVRPQRDPVHRAGSSTARLQLGIERREPFGRPDVEPAATKELAGDATARRRLAKERRERRPSPARDGGGEG